MMLKWETDPDGETTAEETLPDVNIIEALMGRSRDGEESGYHKSVTPKRGLYSMALTIHLQKYGLVRIIHYIINFVKRK